MQTIRTQWPTRLIHALLGIFLFAVLPTHADTLNIAAASDLKFAMDAIVAEFQKSRPKDTLSLVYGSSGKFATQIEQGAPFDVFFSADAALAQSLADKGLAAGKRVTRYGLGRLVLWSTVRDASTLTLASLTDPAISRIAIADPAHAPYGKRAEEALRAAGIWDKVAPKLVYGQNIAQTAQFVQTGNAEVGLIALALALNPELAAKGGYWLVPQNLHSPLEQAFIITKRAQQQPLAQDFAAFFASEPAVAILKRYGFADAGNTPTATPEKKAL